jgi:uncharacterized protein YjiS (DUF1127 family)
MEINGVPAMTTGFVLHLTLPGHLAQAGRALIGRWRERHAARRRLAALSDRDLRDLAVNPAQADYEIAKPFWKE